MAHRFETKKGAGEKFFGFILFLIYVALTTLWDGYIIKTLWNWFVPEVFENGPRITIAPAIVLSLLMSWTTHQLSLKDVDEETDWTVFMIRALLSLVVGAVFLIVGAIAHANM